MCIYVDAIHRYIIYIYIYICIFIYIYIYVYISIYIYIGQGGFGALVYLAPVTGGLGGSYFNLKGLFIDLIESWFFPACPI